MEETGNVKALEKALCVLDAVRDADSPLGVNEIAKICGMSAATVYRMLRTMRSHGWVYQDENEKYTVGYKISLATFGTSFRLAMRETAYHVMARLSESEHEAMNLVVRDPDKCYILRSVEDNQDRRLCSSGRHCSASARERLRQDTAVRDERSRCSVRYLTRLIINV